jgi:hypothetical protein
MRATILAALCAAVVLTVSACGSAGAADSTVLGGGASLAPADTAAFLALDTDRSSAQWDELDNLLGKFPSSDKLVADLKQRFQQRTKLDWDTDVRPALGDEVDVVVLPGAEHEYVVLTKSRDQAKLDALVQKLGDVSARIGEWTAVADTQSALDALSSGVARLADNPEYRAATAKLDDDALAHAYANGEEATKRLNPTIDPEHSLSFEWASADVTAAGDGLRLHVYSRDALLRSIPLQRRPIPTPSYQSHLLDEIPAGVLAVADFYARPGMFSLADPSTLPPQIRDLYEKVPTLPYELDNMFGGESAIYVRRAAFMPELTIVTQPNDTHDAEEALGEIQKALKAQGSNLLGPFQLHHAVIGGQFVVSTSLQGIADFRSGGDKLSGDSSFADAAEAAGMPAATTGFLYVNVKDALPFVQAFGPLLGIALPPLLRGNDLSALRTLTAYGSRTGDDQNYTVYLQIQ